MANYSLGPAASTGTSGSFYQAKLVFTGTKNVSENKTTIAWAFKVWANVTAQSPSNYNISQGNLVTVVINGTTLLSNWNPGTVDLRNTNANNPQTLASGTIDVIHNTDGTKNMSASAIYTAPSWATNLKSITVSGSVTLDPIARKSSITSASNTAIGSATSVVWTPASSSFGYKLTFRCGNWSSTTSAISPGSTSAYTYSYTVPAAVANQITGSTAGTMTVTLESFSEAACTNSIGTDSKTFTVTVPDAPAYNPEAMLNVAAVTGTAFGSYYLSGRTSFSISILCESKYSATHAYTLTVTAPNGTVVFTASGSGSEVETAGPFNAAGTYTFLLSATDSRGRTATAQTTKTVTDYSQPTITAEITRGTGTVQSDHTCSNFSVDESAGTVARITYYIQYTVLTGNGLSVLVIPSSGSPVSLNTATGTVYFSGCDPAVAYAFAVAAYDSVIGSGSPVTEYVTLPVAKFPIDFLPDGSGAGIGMVPDTPDVLQLAWALEVHNEQIRIVDANRVTRATFDYSNGLRFYDSSGNLTKTYPVT